MLVPVQTFPEETLEHIPVLVGQLSMAVPTVIGPGTVIGRFGATVYAVTLSKITP